MSRTVLHVDMDAFFAAIEQERRPELRGRPVVVGGAGDPTRRGVVSTASYEARRYGIHSAMPLSIAYRKCPHAVFLPVDFPVYIEISRKVMDILGPLAERLEVAGFDEAYLEPRPSLGPAVSVAREIQRRIRDRLGLTASVGIGPNRLLAKIASGLEKPGGLTILTQEEAPGKLAPLPAGIIPGVGPKTSQRLAALGIQTVGDLAAADEALLTARFGARWGRYLRVLAQGIDESPVGAPRQRKSIGAETTFEQDLTDPALIEAALIRLVGSASSRLARSRLSCRTLTIKIRYRNFETHTHARTVQGPLSDARELEPIAIELFRRFLGEQPVRLVGIRLSSLEPQA